MSPNHDPSSSRSGCFEKFIRFLAALGGGAGIVALLYFGLEITGVINQTPKKTGEIIRKNEDDTTKQAKATKEYWNRILALENEYFFKGIKYRGKALEHITKSLKGGTLYNEPFNHRQYVEYLKTSASFINKYISEVEKLPTIDVNSELVIVTIESLAIAREMANEISSFALLWESLVDITKNESLVDMGKKNHPLLYRLEEFANKIEALDDKSNENSDSYKKVRVKLIDKYRIEFPLP